MNLDRALIAVVFSPLHLHPHLCRHHCFASFCARCVLAVDVQGALARGLCQLAPVLAIAGKFCRRNRVRRRRLCIVDTIFYFIYIVHDHRAKKIFKAPNWKAFAIAHVRVRARAYVIMTVLALY